MNINLLVFNLAFYLINFLLYAIGREDASAALGVVFPGLGFWVFSFVLLIVFLKRKYITVRSPVDRIAVVTATPIPLFILIKLLTL